VGPGPVSNFNHTGANADRSHLGSNPPRSTFPGIGGGEKSTPVTNDSQTPLRGDPRFEKIAASLAPKDGDSR